MFRGGIATCAFFSRNRRGGIAVAVVLLLSPFLFRFAPFRRGLFFSFLQEVMQHKTPQ